MALDTQDKKFISDLFDTKFEQKIPLILKRTTPVFKEDLNECIQSDLVQSVKNIKIR